jgi:hypothetical protein
MLLHLNGHKKTTFCGENEQIYNAKAGGANSDNIRIAVVSTLALRSRNRNRYTDIGVGYLFLALL